MEAARVAATRGHRVTLIEKGYQLGGAMRLQAMIPTKQPVEPFTRYLIQQVQAAGVTVRRGRAMAASQIRDCRPDVIVFALGALPSMPQIPGIDRENVIHGGRLREMMGGGLPKHVAIRSGWRGALVRLGGPLLCLPWNLAARNLFASVGIPIVFQKRVVIMGGDLTACQLADFLSAKGRVVTIAAMEDELAADLPSTLQQRLLVRLAANGVAIERGIRKFNRITSGGVVVIDRHDRRKTLPADTIMPMLAQDPESSPCGVQAPAETAVFVAGDGAAPLKLLHAVHDGVRVGRQV
jgi:2,4-dienoyl-CoA reductase (NADPH2)